MVRTRRELWGEDGGRKRPLRWSFSGRSGKPALVMFFACPCTHPGRLSTLETSVTPYERRRPSIVQIHASLRGLRIFSGLLLRVPRVEGHGLGEVRGHQIGRASCRERV